MSSRIKRDRDFAAVLTIATFGFARVSGFGGMCAALTTRYAAKFARSASSQLSIDLTQIRNRIFSDGSGKFAAI